MDLYEAIYLRRSVYHFQNEAIEEKTLKNIMNFVNHLEMLDENQQVQFEIIENPEKKGAPYFLVLSAKITEGYELNAGFLMQQVMLYLLTKGLGTLYVPCHKQPVKSIPGYEPVLMLAFGKTNRKIYREPRKAKRMPLKNLCSFKSELSEDMKHILEAGRMAPSKYNSQPWRFVVYENRIHLFCKKEKTMLGSAMKKHRLDAGIALANIYLAAEELWYTSEIRCLENIKEQSFSNNEYLVTILFRK